MGDPRFSFVTHAAPAHLGVERNQHYWVPKLAMTGNSVNTVASIIGLSIAPVFLLAGIAGILNVLAARLARIVDRARSLESDVPTAEADVQEAELKELVILDRRMTLAHWAIGLCTFAALLVCVVVMVMFVAVVSELQFATTVALLFIAAMVSVTFGLLLFLAEVTIATRSVRVSDQFVMNGRSHYRSAATGAS